MRLEVPIEGRILLHSCCAPCSGAVLECLIQNGLDVTVFFSNSNIVPRDEYELRKAELMRYCDALGVECVDDDYDHEAWLDGVRGLENEPERGARCSRCFRLRLYRAASYAAGHGFALLATTLASSRWKDIDQVNAAGEWACAAVAMELKLSSSSPAIQSGPASVPTSSAFQSSPLPESVLPSAAFSSLPSPEPPAFLSQIDLSEALPRSAVFSSISPPEPMPSLSEPLTAPSSVLPSEELLSVPPASPVRPVMFWPMNWRKGGLQTRRSEIIREQAFYNQLYCGCEFAMRNK